MYRLQEFEKLLHREVPLTQHMGIRAEDYDGVCLSMSAEIQPNINIHGTAFGGSMYALAAVAGWGLLRLSMEDRGFSSEVMLASADIQYNRPVRDHLLAQASLDHQRFNDFVSSVAQSQKAKIEVLVTLNSPQEQNQTTAATYRGMYSTI